MKFKENSGARSSSESINEATERLRKENAEKMRKIKEERENREKERNEKKKEESKAKQEDIDEERKKYAKEFQREPLNVEKVKPEDYTSKMRDDDLSYIDNWMQFEFGRFQWQFEELDVETKRRMEIATNSQDLEEIKKWHYEQVKFLHKYLDDKKKEIWALKDRVINTFLRKEDPQDKKRKEEEVQFKKEFDSIYGDLYRKIQYTNFVDDLGTKDTSWIKRARELTAILEDIKIGKFGSMTLETWQVKLDFLKKHKIKIDDFIKEADEQRRKNKSGGQGGTQKPGGGKKPEPEPEKDGKKAERVAIQELGISQAEFDTIVRGAESLNNSELARLTMKVLGAANEGEIKKAYYRCVKEWHPDAKKTRFGIGVNEIKLKVANNLYSEYNKRRGK